MNEWKRLALGIRFTYHLRQGIRLTKGQEQAVAVQGPRADAPSDEAKLSPDRLDSWKEIASHFKRDVRTVQRWERTESLPVHRHIHGQQGSVYAYRAELDAWWNNGRNQLGPPDGAGPGKEAVESTPALGTPSAVPERPLGQVEEAKTQTRPGHRRWLPVGVALLGLASLAIGMFALWLHGPAPALRVTRVVQLTNDHMSKVIYPLVTDGARVYFSVVTPAGLIMPAMVSATGGGTTIIRASLPQARVMDVSSDGSKLLVVQGPALGNDGPLWLMPTTGGSSRRIGDVLAAEATWSPDEKKILFIQGNNLSIMNADGAAAHRLVTLPGKPYYTRWSPDGDRITLSLKRAETNTLWEVSQDGTHLHPVLPDWNFNGAACAGRWTPDGKYLLFDSFRDGPGQIWAIRESQHLPLNSRSEPVRLTRNEGLWFGKPLPSKDGKTVFAVGGSSTEATEELFRYDSRRGQFLPYLAGIDGGELDFSKDGKWVAYVTSTGGNLWLSKLDGSERIQLTSPPMELDTLPVFWETSVRWAPDGKRLAFAGKMSPTSPWNIYLISPDGGNPEQITPAASDQREPNWSPDGKRIMFTVGWGDGSGAIEILDLRTRQISAVPGSERMFFPRWSPDGRYVAAKAVGSGERRLALFDFRTAKWSDLVDVEGVYSLAWSNDGNYLYALASKEGQQGTAFYRLCIASRKWERVLDLGSSPVPKWAGLAPGDSLLELRPLGGVEIYALGVDIP